MNINNLKNYKYFRQIDLHFAGLIARLFPETDPAVLLSAALVSAAAGRGDVCIDLTDPLRRMTAESENPEGTVHGLPDPPALARLLVAHPAVAAPGEVAPLVLEPGGRLYLYRYWRYEKILAAELRRRADRVLTMERSSPLPEALRRLFPEAPEQGLAGQSLAAATAVLKPLCVISGGPGTGKTTAAARIAALLLEVFGADRFRIRMAAPTGKAAARLREAMGTAVGNLDCPEAVRRAVPTDAGTLHRLLGSTPGKRGFAHHRENPLRAEAVIVDEASMVDAALMAALVTALTGDCRLILMGDRDQLASVEAGSVLGDLCGGKRAPGISRHWADVLRSATGLDPAPEAVAGNGGNGPSDALVLLRRNFRFSTESGIGRFSRAVRRGDTNAALEAARDPAGSEPVAWVDANRPEGIEPFLERAIRRGYADLAAEISPEKALELAAGFKILCAVNRGPLGVEALNRKARAVLRALGLVPPGDAPWYPGRPVIITRNDYGLSLFNGDLGIAGTDPATGDLRVFFPADPNLPARGREGGGSVRSFSPFRLPEHRTAYAMTVHRSQGSEFDEVLVVLPAAESPVLTRELIYTAVTRARRRAAICGTEAVLATALSRRVMRASGLYHALWESRSGQTGEDRS